MEGKIHSINGQKKFGFIRSNLKDYFFHTSGFIGNFNKLVEAYDYGMRPDVTFDEVFSEKGPRAENVKIVGKGLD